MLFLWTGAREKSVPRPFRYYIIVRFVFQDGIRENRKKTIIAGTEKGRSVFPFRKKRTAGHGKEGNAGKAKILVETASEAH